MQPALRAAIDAGRTERPSPRRIRAGSAWGACFRAAGIDPSHVDRRV